MLRDLSVEGFVKESDSGNPTPGGGAVAALASALGIALNRMVGNLTINKKGYDELSTEMQVAMEKNFESLQNLENKCIELIDKDSTAFDGVMQAFKLPKATEEEKALRREKIQEGYKKALEVPLEAANTTLEAMKLMKAFAVGGNKNAISDVAVGMLLAHAGLEGALYNVKINLSSIKDESYAKRVNDEVNHISSEGARLKQETMEIVDSRL